MMRLLWTSSSGMLSQSLCIDTIANNVANVNTPGFKKTITRFQDLLYHSGDGQGNAVLNNSRPLLLGQGVRVSETRNSFFQGPLQQTERAWDLAIDGEGFFRITMADGSEAYTRAGSFHWDSEGNIVTAAGNHVELLPAHLAGIEFSHISIEPEGTIRLYNQDQQLVGEGQAYLYRFQNPEGLAPLGDNLWQATANSGTALRGRPGEAGFGVIKQYFLERANVNLIEEMTNLILAQRAYEFSSRSVRTADEMWLLANQLRR